LPSGDAAAPAEASVCDVPDPAHPTTTANAASPIPPPQMIAAVFFMTALLFRN
jgi:hypothetical protein